MGWRWAIVPIRTMISSYDFRKNLLQGNLKTCIHVYILFLTIKFVTLYIM